MFEYMDFAPQAVENRRFRQYKLENLGFVVEAANNWVRDNSVEIINSETLVFPVVSNKPKESFEETSMHVELGNAQWTQVVRLWFRR